MNVSIFVEQKLSYIEWINLAKVNCSFELFLSNVSKYVHFSYNQFKWENDSKIYNILGSSMEVLKIRQTNLQKLDQINLHNLINLKHLDLSFNNLSFISQDSFEFNLNLEYLDLSWNSLYEFSIVLNKLKYLNLDNNQINSTNEVLKDYYSIEIFKMANNRLDKYPSFEMSQIKSENVETFLEFHLNQNQINEIKYFSFIFGRLLLANFDSNQISSIETDAFLNCRSLESLSNFKFNASLDFKCDLVFHLFQFKIHYNLKTDFDNDLFYDSCKNNLIKRENKYNHNKRKCFANFEFRNKEEELNKIDSLYPIL
jgi:Leucine-rich repeat (LRR) protein